MDVRSSDDDQASSLFSYFFPRENIPKRLFGFSLFSDVSVTSAGAGVDSAVVAAGSVFGVAGVSAGGAVARGSSAVAAAGCLSSAVVSGTGGGGATTDVK